MAVRERVAELVERRHGGNVNAAADALGVNYSVLYDLVKGRTKEPKIETLRAISEGYGIPLEHLLGEPSAEVEQRAREMAADLLESLAVQLRQKPISLEDQPFVPDHTVAAAHEDERLIEEDAASREEEERPQKQRPS